MRRYVFPALAIAWLTADQVVKAWVEGHMGLYTSLPLIHGLFALTYVINYGAAFSLLWGKVQLLSVVAAVVTIGILVYERKRADSPVIETVALALILAGALGNLVDRLRIGHVTDMFDLLWHGRNVFPIFNVADIGITCGTALLMLAFYLQARHSRSTTPEEVR